ncbi:MAG: hypothetical protein ACRDLN_00785 [Solirubrobacteraceae bacterium]
MLEPAINRRRFRVVVSEPALRHLPKPVVADLTAHPFRPGETPTLVTLRLDADLSKAVERKASAACLPCALWLRIAVEAARCVTEVAHVLSWPRDRVESACETHANHPYGPPPAVPIAVATLGSYASMVEEGARAGRFSPDGLTARLSDEMYGAWAVAAGHHSDLDHWVAETIAAAPEQCVRYEIAAARASKTLAEWIYASALRAAASSIA